MKSLEQPQSTGKLRVKGAGLELGLGATTIWSDLQIITFADRLLEIKINEGVILPGGPSPSRRNMENIFRRWQSRSATVVLSTCQSVLMIKSGGGPLTSTNLMGISMSSKGVMHLIGIVYTIYYQTIFRNTVLGKKSNVQERTLLEHIVQLTSKQFRVDALVLNNSGISVENDFVIKSLYELRMDEIRVTKANVLKVLSDFTKYTGKTHYFSSLAVVDVITADPCPDSREVEGERRYGIQKMEMSCSKMKGTYFAVLTPSLNLLGSE